MYKEKIEKLTKMGNDVQFCKKLIFVPENEKKDQFLGVRIFQSFWIQRKQIQFLNSEINWIILKRNIHLHALAILIAAEHFLYLYIGMIYTFQLTHFQESIDKKI